MSKPVYLVAAAYAGECCAEPHVLVLCVRARSEEIAEWVVKRTIRLRHGDDAADSADIVVEPDLELITIDADDGAALADLVEEFEPSPDAIRAADATRPT